MSVFEGQAAEICVRMWGRENLTAEVKLFISGNGASELLV